MTEPRRVYRRADRCPYCGSLDHRVVLRDYVASDGERVLGVRCQSCGKYFDRANPAPTYTLRGYGAKRTT